MSNKSDKEFQDLLNKALKDPESINVDELSNEDILKLQKELNPVGSFVDPDAKNPNKQRAALLSIAHLREDYIQRLTLTSMIGFLFTVAREYSCPAELRRWIPKVKNSDKLNEENPTKAPKTEPFNIDTTIDKLQKLLDLAKSVKEEQVELKKIRNDLSIESAATVGKPPSEFYKSQLISEKQHEDRRKILEYLVTYESRLFGISADRDLDQTLEVIKQLPNSEELLNKHPPRAVVWYPRNHTLECPDSVVKNIITGFLKNWFEYNPGDHVRKAHNEHKINRDSTDDHRIDLKDPSRVTVTTVQQKPIVEPSDSEFYQLAIQNKHTKDSLLHILRDARLMDLAVRFSKDDEMASRFRRYLSFIPLDSAARPAIDIIPPQDTYHRINYYMDVNYEELRSAVEAIYDNKPDIEDAIIIYDIVEGTSEEVEKKRKDFLRKHQDNFKSDVLTVTLGMWNLIASFKENRDKVDFYNKNTEIIARVMQRIEDDKKIGTELMKNRVLKEKAKNIREVGPDAPGLTQYRGENKEIMALAGDKAISKEQMMRLEKTRGNEKAAKELEFLEQKEKRKAELEAIKKERPLNKEEEREAREVNNEIKSAKEMLEVPEDAIRVDVFTHNAATGDFGKSVMYTAAEAPTFVAESKNEQMKMMQNTGLGLIPGAHQALLHTAVESKVEAKK